MVRVFLLVAVAAAVAGCTGLSAPVVHAPGAAATTTSAPATQVAAAIDEAPYRRWAKAVERGMANQDASPLTNSLDNVRLARTALGKTHLSLVDRLKYMNFAAGQSEAVHRAYLKFAIDKTPVKLLRVYNADGNMHALFRVIKDVVIYQDFTLNEDNKGYVVVEDIWAPITGRRVSDILRLEALNRLGTLPDDPDDLRVREEGNEAAAAIARATKVTAANLEQAISSLTPACRRNGEVMMEYLTLSARLDRHVYYRLLNECRRDLPGNVSVEALNMWLSVRDGDGPECRRSIAAIERVVGKDPYLDVVRARSYLDSDLPRARKLLEKAMTDEPGLVDAYKILAMVAQAQGKFDEVALLLTTIEQNFGEDMSGVVSSDVYLEFRRSSAFGAYVRSREKTPASVPATGPAHGNPV